MVGVVEVIFMNKIYILPKNITEVVKKFEFAYILINKIA